MHGVFAQAVAYAKGVAAKVGYHDIRVDTHHDNATMQHVITKAGFSRRGIIYLADGDPRIAYELEL
jgi:RimJ/RimL family protein N-acetyltransferase